MKKILAALLALVMLLSLAACSEKKSSTASAPTSPEDIACLYMKAASNGDFATTESYLIYDPEVLADHRMAALNMSETEFYRMASNQVDTAVTNWRDLQKAAQKMVREQMQAQYGDNYAIAVETVSSKSITLEELNSAYGHLLAEAKEKASVDVSAITEAKIVTVAGTLRSNNGTETDTSDVVMVKFPDGWKVLDPDASIPYMILDF